MVNKADPSVFVSADDVRDGGGSSSPGVTIDSPRLSTGSSDKPSSSVDATASNDKTASVAFADNADDQPRDFTSPSCTLQKLFLLVGDTVLCLFRPI